MQNRGNFSLNLNYGQESGRKNMEASVAVKLTTQAYVRLLWFGHAHKVRGIGSE